MSFRLRWLYNGDQPPLRVAVNVGGNLKVAGSLVLLFVESQVQGGRRRCKPNHDIGHVPDFALATALAGTGARFRSTRILTAVGWVAIPIR